MVKLLTTPPMFLSGMIASGCQFWASAATVGRVTMAPMSKIGGLYPMVPGLIGIPVSGLMPVLPVVVVPGVVVVVPGALPVVM